MEGNNKRERLVISGAAGRFPECENFEEFKNALLHGVDLLSADDRRFPAGLWGIPKNMGKCLHIDRFDSSFFGINPKQANFMDPGHRMLLETVYECIVDAGYNPKELRGSSTGVYVAISTFTQLEELKNEASNGYYTLGYISSMAPNRISRAFDLHGPSYSVNSGCSSSMTALTNAIHDIRSGEAESALVCSVQLVLDPHESLDFHSLKVLSPSGKCQVFGTKRDGFVRSEACVSYLIQKERNSRRIYAMVEGSKMNDNGWTEEGIMAPSSKLQLKLMKEVYTELKIDPNEVVYVEAHGTGTSKGDKLECTAIVNMFCQNREKPLLVGSVKSNMGHAEIASGLCSIAKILIAMETGVIPANLHTENIDTEIPGLKEQKLQVLTENVQWDGGIVAVNASGFGGNNVHVVLKSHLKQRSKSNKLPKNRLVVCSGRTAEAVTHLIDGLKTEPDQECLALIDEIHKLNVDGHNYRGYVVLGETITTGIDTYVKDRPIWFIYTGLGSQWPTMGKDLMQIKAFGNCIRRCAAALRPYGVDLISVINKSSSSTFDDIINCFCAVAAVEVAMTDVLFSLGITPDGFAGHSVGEVGCAYANGHITPEQAVLLAYARGLAVKNTKLIPGQMAAIRLSKEELSKILPEDIFIACQNGKESMTISGPVDSVKAFVLKLTSQGIFAKVVDTAGTAFHSKYIRDAGAFLLAFLKTILKEPIPRSSKWVSTSVSPSQRSQPWTGYNCAEYHHNNFCNPVLFDQVYEYIPDNAVVIEVGPHGLLQAILKHELGQAAINISLGNHSSDDNERFFLSAIGRIFLAGGQPKLRNLYEDVKFPVSRGTKMISPMVRWDHSISWFTPKWKNTSSPGEVISVDLSSEKYSFLTGYEIDGRILMPASGYLELVWTVFAKMHLKEPAEFPVVMEKINFKRTLVLLYDEIAKFRVNIMEKSGYFEIFEGDSIVVAGMIRVPNDIASEFSQEVLPASPENCYLVMKTNDFYKEFRLRKYTFKGLFQGITECDVHGSQGKLKWFENFTAFLDAMLQLNIIADTNRRLMLPTSIDQVIIDPIKHLDLAMESKEIPFTNNKNLNIIKSGSIEIVGLKCSNTRIQQSGQDDPCLETFQFINYESPDNHFDLATSLKIALEIVLQNATGLIKQIKIWEFQNKDADEILSETLTEISKNLTPVDIHIYKCGADEINCEFDLIVLTENWTASLPLLVEKLSSNGFILQYGTFSEQNYPNLQIIFQSTVGERSLSLLRPESELPQEYAILNITNSNFDWLDQLQALSKTRASKVVYIVSQAEETSGIIGLMKCLQTEPSSLIFRSIFVNHVSKPFSLDNEFYRNQLKKNLAFNISRKSGWGTMVYVPLVEIEKKAVGNAAITIFANGDLPTLNWEERPTSSTKIHRNSELIYTFYCALNSRDVNIASGKVHPKLPNIPTLSEMSIGQEYSGITTSGRRVMGLLGYEALALQVQSDPSFLWDVPDTWSLRNAATVPFVYATGYYALIARGAMLPGEFILIPAGAGGIGMAAISIAISMGCGVFTTVGSQAERDIIKETFPELKDEYIGNSTDSSFENTIMEKTEGNGVDLVLISSSTEMFQSPLRCIARRGRVLTIGKVDFLDKIPVDTRIFLENHSYHVVSLDDLIFSKCLLKDKVHTLVKQGIALGVVKPLPCRVFSEKEVEYAFGLLTSGYHLGKILIEVRKESATTLKSPCRDIIAVPKFYFDPKKTFILVGGLGGVGLELADWLIRRGATKIVLNSRRAITNGYQSYCFKKWSRFKDIVIDISTDDTTSLEGTTKLITKAEKLGPVGDIVIDISTDDTTSLEGTTKLITKAEKLGPVGGIFNSAMVLRDALVSNQTKKHFEDVFKAKIVSVQNMDIVSREHCRELEHFVAFSSYSCGRGNIGQINYGMANSAVERLCEKRRRENLPGLAIQFGPIADVGFVADTELHNEVFNHLVQPQNIASCLNSLEKFMTKATIIGSCFVKRDTITTSTRLTKSPIETVAHIMGIRNIDLVDKSLTLSQLGLESLMLAEIIHTLYEKHQIELDIEGVRDLTLHYFISLEDGKDPRIQPTKSQ